MKLGFDFRLFTKETLSPYIKKPGMFKDNLDKVVHSATQKFIEREYKKEIPVSRGRKGRSGAARSAVSTYRKGNGNWAVASLINASTNLMSKNMTFGYPKFVHRGTYDYRNDPRDYGGAGRVGATAGRGKRNSKKKGAFEYVDIRSGKKGIRPNKFADRAAKKGKPEAIRFISQKILSSKL